MQLVQILLLSTETREKHKFQVPGFVSNLASDHTLAGSSTLEAVLVMLKASINVFYTEWGNGDALKIRHTCPRNLTDL